MIRLLLATLAVAGLSVAGAHAADPIKPLDRPQKFKEPLADRLKGIVPEPNAQETPNQYFDRCYVKSVFASPAVLIIGCAAGPNIQDQPALGPIVNFTTEMTAAFAPSAAALASEAMTANLPLGILFKPSAAENPTLGCPTANCRRLLVALLQKP